MRWAALLVLTACGFSARLGGDDGVHDAMPDGDSHHDVEPQRIPGGGIADAPIGGEVNVYVVDNASDIPIAGATVDVAGIQGTTDSTGLFVASAATLVGKQTIVVTVAGFRSEVWVGAAGANVTIPLQKTPVPSPARATVSGTINGFAGITVTGLNHVKAAFIDYSDSDQAAPGANDIQSSSVCTANPNPNCAWSVTTRTGKLALMAPVLDVDTKGDAFPQNDTFTIITWAYKLGLTLGSNQTLANQTLDLVPAGSLVNITADLGAPPAGTTNQVAVAGLELGADGIAQLGVSLFTTQPVKGPSLSLFPGATYRLTAVAASNEMTSVVLRRGLTSTAMAIGTWLDAPTGITASRTGASFTPPASTAMRTVRYENGSNQYLQFTIFDDTTQLTVPSAVALPTTALTATVAALRGPFDVTSFTFPDIGTQVTDVAARTAPVN